MKAKEAWTANHHNRGKSKVTTKFTEPVKLYTRMEDAVIDSATPSEGPSTATHAAQLTDDAPTNVRYANENVATSSYANLVFDPASSDHMLNH